MAGDSRSRWRRWLAWRRHAGAGIAAFPEAAAQLAHMAAGQGAECRAEFRLFTQAETGHLLRASMPSAGLDLHAQLQEMRSPRAMAKTYQDHHPQRRQSL